MQEIATLGYWVILKSGDVHVTQEEAKNIMEAADNPLYTGFIKVGGRMVNKFEIRQFVSDQDYTPPKQKLEIPNQLNRDDYTEYTAEQRRLWMEYIKFRRKFLEKNEEIFENRGLSIMGNAERAFLIENKAIVVKGYKDFVAQERYCFVSKGNNKNGFEDELEFAPKGYNKETLMTQAKLKDKKLVKRGFFYANWIKCKTAGATHYIDNYTEEDKKRIGKKVEELREKAKVVLKSIPVVYN